MIHIFIVCTGAFSELWENKRIRTLNYLFINYEKTFNLISDKNNLENFQSVLSDEYVKYNYYHICNLVYPFVTLHKYDYIDDACKQFGYDPNDFFLYLDSHSICIYKRQQYWDNIVNNELSNYDICYANNPYVNDKMIYDEIDPRSKHYIDLETFEQHKDLWAQLSFLMGKVEGLHKFKIEINKLILADTMHSGNSRKKNSIIANYTEQHYANYLFFDILIFGNNHDLNINHGKYIMKNKDIISRNPESFIICHHYAGYKAAHNVMHKHNSNIYKDNL